VIPSKVLFCRVPSSDSVASALFRRDTLTRVDVENPLNRFCVTDNVACWRTSDDCLSLPARVPGLSMISGPAFAVAVTVGRKAALLRLMSACAASTRLTWA
jgi:hypothetical protein